MEDFYEAYYTVIENSQAHQAFCEAAYGMDLDQHGFADQEQLDLLLQVTGLNADQRVFDLGCGSGKITEYLSDCTGAHFTGVDNEPVAIHQAHRRTVSKSKRLDFVLGDINRPGFASQVFDVLISIDSIYFCKGYEKTVKQWKTMLRAGGQMAIFFSYGWRPSIRVEEFPVEKLMVDKTDMAEALDVNGLKFNTWDLTAQDFALAQRKVKVLANLEPQFQAEGAGFIHDDRLKETEGILQAINQGLYVRYLYHVQLD